MPKANPLFSAGARYERAAFRDYLRGKIVKCLDTLSEDAFKVTLRWILERQKRYDKKPGGLGK